MTRFALVRTVMIASPRDAEQLMDSIRNLVFGWNDANDQSTEILEPATWKMSVFPNLDARNVEGQDEVEAQLVERSDMIIGVFRLTLGTPTQSEVSGSASEIRKHLKSGRVTMVYFSDEKPGRKREEKEEFERLQDFKKECKGEGLYCEFSGENDLLEKVSKHLNQAVTRRPIPIDSQLAAIAKRANTDNVLLTQSFDFSKIRIDESDRKSGIHLRCATFVTSREEGMAWTDDKDFKISSNRLSKAVIRRRMKDMGDSFKFYLRVPDDQLVKAKFLKRLANADVVVTGLGERREAEKWYRIWFLHCDGFVHPYGAIGYTANHSLVDMSVFRL